MKWEEGWSLKREWTHVYPWLIPVHLWQKLMQYCRAIILQLNINKLGNKDCRMTTNVNCALKEM